MVCLTLRSRGRWFLIAAYNPEGLHGLEASSSHEKVGKYQVFQKRESAVY